MLFVNIENYQVFIFDKARPEKPHRKCNYYIKDVGGPMNTSSLND
jgi:hypothetical protein